METWEYLRKFHKPITLSGLKFLRINGSKGDFMKAKVITWREYRKKFGKIYDEKFEIAKKAGGMIAKIPWLEAMMVTGSVASGYPDVDDDIDIMFICQRDTIWICRALVYALLFVCGFKIRRNSIEVKDRLCLNLWVEENYGISKDKQNLKNAMDGIMAKTIFGDKVWSSFLINNDWIQEYVSFGYKKKVTKNRIVIGTTTNILVVAVNFMFYIAQRIYMKKKGRETVDLHKAFFHP